MLKRLYLRNFTVFADAEFEFGPGLNVIVGTNGTGKSHVLKLGYAVQTSYFDASLGTELKPTFLDNISKQLLNIFLPDNLGLLVRRSIPPNSLLPYANVRATLGKNGDGNVLFSIASLLNHNIVNQHYQPAVITGQARKPVFIPAKEVLTSGWLPSLYDRREIPIDRTYPDVVQLLMGPPLRQPEPAYIINKLQQLIGGKVEEEGGRFYLSTPEQPRMEMNLVAEGMRKFATLYKLLANGTLTPETTLFWDEPEANLNPALLKKLAAILAELARAGFQIVLATHSLFLLKEFHILSQQEKLPVRYFGLSAEAGEATTVTAADNLELLPNIVALDAELDQSDRFQRVLDQEDADHN